MTVVTGASVQLPDPADPSQSVLLTGGSGVDDKISFTPKKGPGGGVQVTVNGRSHGVFSTGGRIVVGAGAGNDRVTVAKVAMPVQLDAGVGNDTVTGSPLNDVLAGGSGNDRITGGSGRDLLIGGEGADRLSGGGDDDILIGGTTDHSAGTAAADPRATRDLLAAWSGADDYASRAAQLATGNGPSGARLTADTVDRDAARDTLAGDAGRDLVFAVLDPAAQPDLVKGRKPDETVVGV